MKILVFSLFILSFASCTLDKDFEYNSGKDLLVVNCILSPENAISMSILKAGQFPNTTDTFSIVRNAHITLIENDNEIGYLTYNETTKTYELNYNPKVASQYAVKIEVPGYDNLTASTYIPDDFEVETCYYFANYTTAKIYLSNLANMESYWIHFVSKIWYDFFSDSSYFREQEIRAPQSEDRIFDDFNILDRSSGNIYSQYLRIPNNQSKDINFQVTSSETLFWLRRSTIENLVDGEYLDMVVFKASREMDLYWKAILLNYENSNFSQPNPFYEPIGPYTNIKNGVGIFAGINIKRVSIIENKCK